MEGKEKEKEKEHKHKNRLKGLFSKEKKPTAEGDVDDFLRGSSDKLHFQAQTAPSTASQEEHDSPYTSSDKLNFASPPPTSNPTPLSRLDTSSAQRWPTAAEVQRPGRVRRRSTSPKRSKKGLVVRFTDNLPEVIGEGGDKAELPTISLRQRAHSHPPNRPSSREPAPRDQRDAPPPPYTQADEPRPGLLRRAPTRFESISDSQNGPVQPVPPLPAGDSGNDSTHNGYMRTESLDPTSFAARTQAEMRAGEGMALRRSSKVAEELSLMDESLESSTISFSPQVELPQQTNKEDNPQDMTDADMPNPINEQLMKLGLPDHSLINFRPQFSALRSNTTVNKHIPQPPPPSSSSQLSRAPPIPPLLNPGPRPNTEETLVVHSAPSNDRSAPLPKTSTLAMQGTAVAVGDDALQDFSTRVEHLFNIFLLSAESMRPISKCSLEDFVRAALWWFLKGRLHLEATVRDRPTTPGAQQTNFLVRQQAYTDLAKSLWILKTITPQCPEFTSKQQDPHMMDILETRKAILPSLRKLAMSMKRNNFLPPEEATLPQGFDTSIWAQDDGNRSLIASQKQTDLPNPNDYFPLGDTNRSFHYGRAFAAGVLVEDADSRSQEYRSPVLISIIRGLNQTALSLVIAGQDGMLKVCVQEDKSVGPTWDNVAWNSKTNMIDVRLPRGFLLRLQCSSQDFRILRGIYDYQKKILRGLVRRNDEELVFETFPKTFQYFDQDPASTFPKESLSNCRLRLFEKTVVEKGAAGPRSLHRGFRIGLVTSLKTKNLRGINQDLPATVPTQFGFLRGEGGLPALLLRFSNEKSKYSVVFTFEDVTERTELHARFTGISLGDREAVVMESEIKGFSVATQAQAAEEKDYFKRLEWQSARVINEEQDEPSSPKTVLSANLRIAMDFRGGSITDRVNIGPGELKIRLDVNNSNELKVLRQPQQDMTVSISESQVPPDLSLSLASLLTTLATTQTTRTYTFPSLHSLHAFQACLTGFTVLFDGTASSFNISRRRMVVPIYKKWDAATTRLQIVQRDKAVQLLAFFENFSHGHCMNFALKSTDVFETAGRHGRSTLRIVDAKFAMPRTVGEGGSDSAGAGNESAFVCLDMLEYPGEHDDITIVFDAEAELENFAKALPAPVKAASRMPSVRR